jgi:hypothetical protein
MSFEKAPGPTFVVCRGKIRYPETMKQEDFLKKVGVYARYLTQFLSDGDIPKIIETIRDLEKIREQAEREKVED